jgi:hypothetical protein
MFLDQPVVRKEDTCNAFHALESRGEVYDIGSTVETRPPVSPCPGVVINGWGGKRLECTEFCLN